MKKTPFLCTVKIILLTMMMCSASIYSIAATDGLKVTINKKSNNQTDYMNGLLRLALSYSEKPYVFDSTESVYSRDRVLDSLRTGEISVMWGGTSTQMESDFIPIKIDAYRGLMNHRLFFIRENTQASFSQIKTKEDLQKMTLGQGRSWQDALILEKAGFTVIRATKKNSLFYMLDGGRFDAFPRGTNEVVTELKEFPDLKLTVEQNLVLIYPLPTYFFVTKTNPTLAEDIERGLKTAVDDGGFDRYFFENPEIIHALRNANLAGRTAIHIDNPFLPENTEGFNEKVTIDFTTDPRVAKLTQKE